MTARRIPQRSTVKKEGRRLLTVVLPLALGLLALTLASAISATSQAYSSILENRDLLLSQRKGEVTLLDITGALLFRDRESRPRDYVPLEQIPTSLRQAIIAVEDDNFYHNHGISLRGIARAVITNVQARDLYYSGGSTISQQLVRNLLLTPEKSLKRKFQEIVLSYDLEQRYSKNQILEMYLNAIYFGRGAYGVGEAADAYFGKPVQALTPLESAYLAGLPKAPSLYAQDGRLASERFHFVLARMREERYLTQELTETDLPEVRPYKSSTDRDILLAAFLRGQLTKLPKDKRRVGLEVTTTIDLKQQKEAAKLWKKSGGKGVIVLDGAKETILGMTRSPEFFDELARQQNDLSGGHAVHIPGEFSVPHLFQKITTKDGKVLFERGASPASTVVAVPLH